MDMSQYKDLFISEVREHLDTLSENIVSLESDPGDRDRIDALFRVAHSIKGMAASMGYGAIAELAHKMEDLMDKVRKATFAFEAAIADLFLEGADLLADMVREVEGGGTGERDISEMVRKLETFTPSTQAPDEPPQEEVALPPSPEKSAEPPLVSPGRAPGKAYPGEPHRPPQTVRVRTEVLDSLINITGELVTSRNMLVNIAAETRSRPLDAAVSALSRQIRELHDEVLKVRLTPFGSVAERLPRMVRDLARKEGKEVALRISGKEIELDRGILDDLSDPLLHILRNAVDHGIEPPHERLAAGKNVTGTISIEVRKDKERVLLDISDDGRGMDPVRIVSLAIERGLVSPEESRLLSPRQAFLLTCLPGFSTAVKITDISGRGVGMDVVKSSLQSLGGNLAIDSEVGKGSTFTLSLPVSISIIPVLLVDCPGLSVAFPVDKVVRTLDMKREEIASRGRKKVFLLGEEEIPLVSLNRIIGLPIRPVKGAGIPAVVVELRGRKVGLVVDRFMGQQDVFVKPFGRPLNRMKGLVGGAVLGDGQIVCILDPAELLG